MHHKKICEKDTLNFNGLEWKKEVGKDYYRCDFHSRDNIGDKCARSKLVPFNDNGEISFIKFDSDHYLKNNDYKSHDNGITQNILSGRKINRMVGYEYIYKCN